MPKNGKYLWSYEWAMFSYFNMTYVVSELNNTEIYIPAVTNKLKIFKETMFFC